MRLSIIVPIYRRTKDLSKFLEKIETQSSKNFELILVIDTVNDDPLSIVEKFLKKTKMDRKDIIIIFNSKRVGRAKALSRGIKSATGNYTFFLCQTDIFEKDLVQSLEDEIQKSQADIIEFRAAMKSPLKLDGALPKVYNDVVNIDDNHEIFTNIYRYDFNKIFRTELLKKVTDFQFNVISNSRYSIEFAFKMLLTSTTYSNVDKEFVTSKSDLSNNFNPLKEIRQWNALKAFMLKIIGDKFFNEWKYAFTRAMLLQTLPIVLTTKNKNLILKFKESLKKQIEALDFKHNPYVVNLPNDDAKKLLEKIKRL